MENKDLASLHDRIKSLHDSIKRKYIEDILQNAPLDVDELMNLSMSELNTFFKNIALFLNSYKEPAEIEAKLLALHSPYIAEGCECNNCVLYNNLCSECEQVYPCDTIKTLEGE